MATASQSSATPRERRLSRVRSLFLWPQAGGQFESEPKEETTTAVSDWTAPAYTSRAARRVSFLDVQDPPEPVFHSVRDVHHRLSVPPVLDFLAPYGYNWNAMSVRSRRSKATPPPLDIPEDAIAGPSSSVATLPLPPSQGKAHFIKRALRGRASLNSLRTRVGLSNRPGDRSSVESTYSTSATSEHSLSGTTAYSPSDYGDFENEKAKDVLDIAPDVYEAPIQKPVLVTPLKPDYPFEGCEGLLQLDRETNDVLSHLTPPDCPAFLRWRREERFDALDIGCGFGDWVVRAATQWPRAKVLGIDLNSHWETLSCEKAIPFNAKFEEHDFLNEGLSYGDESFDHVRIANCQFRVKPAQWSCLLHEAHRVLKIGGHLELIDEELISPDTSIKRQRASSQSTERPLDFDELESQQEEDNADPLQRNCQELETIFHHALLAAGLAPSHGRPESEEHSESEEGPSFVHLVLQHAFGRNAETVKSYELSASLPGKKKTSKFFGASPREEYVILKATGHAPRRLSLDTRYALRGSDALLVCQEFIQSFVAEQRDQDGAPLVKRKDLEDAFWDYEHFRERRFHWRSERHRSAFDDDADVLLARSRPSGPRRSDGGDTGSMVGSVRRAFERTTSSGGETYSSSGRGKVLERSQSFDSDVTPRPIIPGFCAEPMPYLRWTPGDAYELSDNRMLVPLRRFKVYIATKRG